MRRDGRCACLDGLAILDCHTASRARAQRAKMTLRVTSDPAQVRRAK